MINNINEGLRHLIELGHKFGCDLWTALVGINMIYPTSRDSYRNQFSGPSCPPTGVFLTKSRTVFLLDTVVGPCMLSWSSLEDSNYHLPETSKKMLAADSRHACCVDDTNDIAGVPGSSHAWNPLSSPQYLDISVFFFFFLHQLLWILFLSLKNEVKSCYYQYNINCKGKSKKKHISQSFRRSTRIPLSRFSPLYKRILYWLSIGLDCSNQPFMLKNHTLLSMGFRIFMIQALLILSHSLFLCNSLFFLSSPVGMTHMPHLSMTWASCFLLLYMLFPHPGRSLPALVSLPKSLLSSKL